MIDTITEDNIIKRLLELQAWLQSEFVEKLNNTGLVDKDFKLFFDLQGILFDDKVNLDANFLNAAKFALISLGNDLIHLRKLSEMCVRASNPQYTEICFEFLQGSYQKMLLSFQRNIQDLEASIDLRNNSSQMRPIQTFNIQGDFTVNNSHDSYHAESGGVVAPNSKGNINTGNAKGGGKINLGDKVDKSKKGDFNLFSQNFVAVALIGILALGGVAWGLGLRITRNGAEIDVEGSPKQSQPLPNETQ